MALQLLAERFAAFWRATLHRTAYPGLTLGSGVVLKSGVRITGSPTARKEWSVPQARQHPVDMGVQAKACTAIVASCIAIDRRRAPD